MSVRGSPMLQRIVNWFSSLKQKRLERLHFERRIMVAFDDAEISATYPSGKIERIAWADVERVVIETNDRGPWAADFWWIFEGAGKRCAYPMGATGEAEAMRALPERFPGFDHEALIDANCSTDNARFLCWERPPS